MILLIDSTLKLPDPSSPIFLASNEDYFAIYYGAVGCCYGLSHVILGKGGFELELELIERLS